MMLSNLNLSSLPECNFEVRYVDSVLLNPCAEYQRLLRMGKVARIAANFSEYIANEPKVSYRDGRYFVFDGQNTIEARKTCNGGRDLPIRCKVFYGLSKEHEALLFAVQTGISSELTAGEQLRAKLVAHEENACDFVSVTEDTGVRFALDGIRAPWKIYCIRSAYYIYKSYGAALYREMLSILVDVWDGDSDSFLSGILHGMARFLALYQGEYSRERLIGRLRTVHPKTITRLAQNGTGEVRPRYSCFYKIRHPGDCDGQSGYGVSKLDSIVEEVVRQIFAQFREVSRKKLLESVKTNDAARIQKKVKKIQKDLESKQKELDDLKAETILVIRGVSALDKKLLGTLVAEAREALETLEKQLVQAQEEYEEATKTAKRSNYICNELFTWADVYDTANHDERRAILQQFIKEIRVRKEYEISITLNASFNQVEQLKAVSTYDGAEIFEEISEKGA